MRFSRRLVALCAAGVLACAHAPDSTEPSRAPDTALGARVYRQSCAPCHGGSGGGDGPAAAALDLVPRDLTTGIYRYRSTPSGQPPTSDDLYRTITVGLYGTPMRGFASTLTDHERRSVVAFIQTLSTWRPPESVVEVGQPPPANVVRGRELWLEAGCYNCHGELGAGDGPANATLKDDQGRPTPAHDMTAGYLKRGLARESVWLTLSTGLDGTPMPSYQEALSDSDRWALADCVLSLVPERSWWQWLVSPVDRDYR